MQDNEKNKNLASNEFHRVFVLHERFSEPIWMYYYNIRSLYKYWILTRDIISDSVFTSQIPDLDFSLDEVISSYEDLEDFYLDPRDNMEDHNDDLAFDRVNIPQIQKGLVIANIYTLIEKFLRDICFETDEKITLDGKGSYIHQYVRLIRENNSIKVSKEHLRSFEAFGHIRNTYIHKFDTSSIPESSVKYIDEICGPFAKYDNGLSNVHVDVFFKLAFEFGRDFQASYWKDFV